MRIFHHSDNVIDKQVACLLSLVYCFIHFLCPETPGAPRGPLIAKNEGRDAVTLSWQAPLDDRGSPITGYVIDKLDVQRGGWQRAAKIAPGQVRHIYI